MSSSDPGADVGIEARLPSGREVAPAAAAPVILLASTSPQRRAILEQLGIPFQVVPPRYGEEDEAEVPAVELARRHARGKARSVLAEAAGRPVLGADTAVVCGRRVLGKPGHAGQAEAMLRLLSGRWHEVVSAVCLVTGDEEAVEHAVTRVLFRPLSGNDIRRYLATGEWRGRAGGYAVQGRGSSLVERIDGDYLNVVGLPGQALLRLLARRLSPAWGGDPWGAGRDRLNSTRPWASSTP